MFKVQRLGPGDIAAMNALLSLFGDVFDDPVTYRSQPPSDLYLNKLLADQAFIALIASEGDAAIGGLTAYELVKFEQERSEIYIYDLAVAESDRRRGVATALIDHVRGIARALGAWTVFVQADRGDDPAIALYSKLGAREDVLHFDISPHH